MSIKQYGDEDIILNLEIDMDTELDDLYFRFEKDIGKNKIIRKISVFSEYRQFVKFITDKENENNRQEF